jgi:hypothetical protein
VVEVSPELQVLYEELEGSTLSLQKSLECACKYIVACEPLVIPDEGRHWALVLGGETPSEDLMKRCWPLTG